jgi:tetratricopeptide (TPR) repeat protein
MTQITVQVWDATGNNKAEIVLADDVPVSSLLPTLLHRLAMPADGPEGQPLSYSFQHQSSGRQLQDTQSLAEGGVTHGDILLLQQTAGASSLESKPKKISAPIYTYAVSWKWIIVGFICVLVLGGVVGATYVLQTRNMSKQILDVVKNMIEKSDELKAEMEKTDDVEAKSKLAKGSVDRRRDAVKMLDAYRRSHQENPVESVLTELYKILDSLYKDCGEGTTTQGLQFGTQLSELALELTRNAGDDDLITYRKRLVELEWDRRRSATEIVARGKELLEALLKMERPYYEAARYIALALFENLNVEPYDPKTYALPLSIFPETMDTLLMRLNSQKPGDIEIAKRYAEFIVSIDHREPERRQLFVNCASEQLWREKTPEARQADAKRVIDTMVQHNSTDPAAFLARYHFNTTFMPNPDTLGVPDSDLQTVLKLAPGHAEGLILSSVDAIRRAGVFTENGELELAQNARNQAEAHLLQTVKFNPSEPLGYQYLGDFYLFVKNDPKKAVEVWSEGLKNSNHRGDEELIGRLVIVLLGQKAVDEVRGKLEHLTRTIAEMRLSRPGDVKRTTDMLLLLTAQLLNTEAEIAATKADVARLENKPDEARRLLAVVQQKRGDAIQKYEDVLRDWGGTQRPLDYIFLYERRSVYSMLLPESLLQLGNLKLDWGEWDSAASYFAKAARPEIRSPAIQRMALLRMSVAFQQGGRTDRAVGALRAVASADPNDLAVRYAYGTLLFRNLVTSNSVSTAALDDAERELTELGNRRNELPQPWALDLRLIHLGVLRANLTNDTAIIMKAMDEATRKFRDLETQSYPPDAEGKERKYIDDPAFVAEMVGIYSSFSEGSDFARLLEKLRSFPEGGEDAYYEALINDSLRRGDTEGAIVIIDEAVTSTRLTAAKKERFVALLQSLKERGTDATAAMESVYVQLKTTYDASPESLKPQAFFMLADISLDRGDVEQAKRIMERLRAIEGNNGTHWKYIEVRIMLTEKDPDYERMRQLQETLAGLRVDWDRAYILRTLIEEKYLEAFPGDAPTISKLIESYQAVTRAGNRNQEIWQRLIDLLESADRRQEAVDATREASMLGIALGARQGQLPQPYGRMYADVQTAISNEDPSKADRIAQECVKLAEIRGAAPELIVTLNLVLGKVFLDSQMYDSAIRHFTVTAQRGGTFVYPLALCVAKSGDIDGGFTLLLDEIDLVPGAMTELLPTVLVLLVSVQPTEKIYERIDKLMERLERGERLTMKGTFEEAEEDHVRSLGTRFVPTRKIQTLVFRFPENKEELNPSAIQFLSPEDLMALTAPPQPAEVSQPQPTQPAEVLQLQPTQPAEVSQPQP